MKIKRYQTSAQNRILTALITNDIVLSAIASQFKGNLFPNPWANQIAQWCIDYFEKRHRAPGKAIKQIFIDFAEKRPNDEKVDLIEKYLSHLNNERANLDGISSDDLIEQASTYFKAHGLRKLSEEIVENLDANDPIAADQARLKYENIELVGPSWETPSDHTDLIWEDEESSPMVVPFPKDMGKFIGRWFVKGEFIIFLGPTGKGKSFWLQECVVRALKARRRVLYYVLGDMTRKNVAMRWVARIAKRPIERGKAKIPTEIVRLGPKDSMVEGTPLRFKKNITRKEVQEAEAHFRKQTSSDATGLRIRMRFAGARVISAGEIEQDVIRCKRQGWDPHLVVIDYLDNLKPEPFTHTMQPRDQNNLTWQVVRRIASDQDCLVVGATQGSAISYNAWLLQKKHFSEDRRKNDNASGMIGINQTDEEKELGIYRLNWVKNRHAPWAERKFIWTAGDLSIANPCIISKLDAPTSKSSQDNRGDDGEQAPDKKRKNKDK